MSNVDYSLVTTSSKTGDDNSATSTATSCAWWHGATLSRKISYVFLGAVFVLIPTFVGLDAAGAFEKTPAVNRATTTVSTTVASTSECPVESWIISNQYSLYQKEIVDFTITNRKACAEIVGQLCPTANIANYDTITKECYCQYHGASLETFNGDESVFIESCRLTTDKTQIPWRLFCGAYDTTATAYNNANVQMCEMDALFDENEFDAAIVRDIKELDVADVENFDFTFANVASPNLNLINWNVSSGTSFQSMFDDASNFNSDLSTWSVGNAVNFKRMFRRALSFDNNLADWDVSGVTDFTDMFKDATQFLIGANIGTVANWDVCGVDKEKYNSNIFTAPCDTDEDDDPV